MKILALDCSGDTCSVALSIAGQVQQRITTAATQQHSRLILPMQADLLKAAGIELSDLDCIACGTGPGSFTGVRVATAICQGLAYGAGVPTLGVSTLAAMAWGICHLHSCREALVAVDARMDELYWGHYAVQDSGLSVLRADSLSPANALSGLAVNNCVAAGNGWIRYADDLAEMASRCDTMNTDYPLQAADIAALAACLLSSRQAALVPPASLQPVYLRNQVTG